MPDDAGMGSGQHHKRRRIYGIVRRAGMIRDEGGSVLIEAAIALPVLITLLLGIVSYGSWMMAAHSVQLAANEAARAALTGLNQTERDAIANASVSHSVLADRTVDARHIAVVTARDGVYYTVTVRYDFAGSGLAIKGPLATPGGIIARSAIVRLTSS